VSFSVSVCALNVVIAEAKTNVNRSFFIVVNLKILAKIQYYV
jgi:hypothetical protein